MNAILPIRTHSHALQVSHTIAGYDRPTQRLSLEFEVHDFLDTLAQKIAEVDGDDPRGVFTYSLTQRQVTAFSFILGLDADLGKFEYFLEPSSKKEVYSDEREKAVSVLAGLSARSQRRNRENRRITKSELTVPTLRVLDAYNGAWVTTSDLIRRLTEIFEPSGMDAEILSGRSDTYFSQKIRNIISHKESGSSFIKNSFAEYGGKKRGLRITKLGSDLIRAL